MTGTEFSRWKIGLVFALALALIGFVASKGEAHPFQDGDQARDPRQPVLENSLQKEHSTAPSVLESRSPGTTGLPSPVFLLANELNRNSLSQPQSKLWTFSRVQFNRPPLSPRGAPGNRKGGGTRDGHRCSAVEIKDRLMALVPAFESEQPVSHVWGLTVEASPTLWFYFPYLPKDVKVGELELWDETDRDPRNYQQIYQGVFTVAGTPGVISLSLPPTVKLELDKNYHWYLSLNINCNGENESVNVNGWIQRVKFDNTLSAQKQSAERDRVILYAKNRIWYDALTLLAQLRRRYPQTEILVADWKKLLGDVGLEEVAAKAIAPCCTLERSLAATE